jgi:hypothetical protein
MASHEWIATYRTYDSDELDAEIAFLKKASKNLFATMGVGSKSNSRDLRDIRDRLSAATRVKQEKGRATMTPQERGDYGVADFSNSQV